MQSITIKIKRFVLSTSLLAALLAPLAFSAPAAALFEGDTGAASQACKGIALDETTKPCEQNSDGGIESLLKTVLNMLSIVAGVVAIIMIMIAGLRFVTSQGDSQSTASARNTIIYAVIGLVVVFISQFIVIFVIGKLT